MTSQFWGTRTTTTMQQEKEQQPKQQSTLLQRHFLLKIMVPFTLHFYW